MTLSKDDLLAISQLLGAKIDPLKEDIAELKEDVAELKKDNRELKTEVALLKEETAALGVKLERLEERVGNLEIQVKRLDERVCWLEKGMKHTHILLEQNALPRLQNIEECYTSTYQRYAAGAAQIDALQIDMDTVKSVVHRHSQQLKELS